MEIIGIILLVISAIMFFTRRNQQQKLFSIKRARSVTAAELTDMAGAIADEIGGGNWRDYVKLWGQITTDEPLQSEHQQAPCVYYVSTVTREYEEKNEEGKLVRKTEQVSRHRQFTKFWLKDDTGSIVVNPDGAAIDTVEIMNELREERSGATLGYRYQESVLPVGKEVLVLGAVSDATGKVVIGQPTQTDHKYLISLKDEEHLAIATSRSAQNMGIAMFVMLGLGAVLLIWGLVF
ncbi:E3 ubiquitin ligase family protein [Leptolyngbya iicbica]|uniref:RING-type E3 ubiquitin transferase n=2 Tax=Cyanophyceae TaxID=3028117 RepID=A0A4Q7E1L1_9CYAN|nr:E3 ubiquitin ligase family protein [Leptolyngbya sp. LK]RZM75201.1 E3 ubiquitin ligase [Leptolyngbya sp. LK]